MTEGQWTIRDISRVWLMSTGFFVRTSTLLSALILTIAVATPAAASSGATGNAQAIALYTKAAKTTNALPVLRDTSTNYFYLEDNSSTMATSGFRFQRGVPRAPGGYVDAKVIETYRVIGGKVKWVITRVLPYCGATSACAHSVGLEFYDTPTSEKVVYLTGAEATYCWAQSFTHANAYFGGTIGASVWYVGGRFLPVKMEATQTIFTSKYSSGGQNVTETDWVAKATNRFVRSHYQATAVGQYPAYSFDVVETDPARALLAPSLPTCNG
jgi:hypothetical protein